MGILPVSVHAELFKNWLDMRLPEWVQAFAALVALFIAIYIPLRIRNSERRAAEEERDRKAHALALFIFADVLQISFDVSNAVGFLQACSEPSHSTRYPRQRVLDEVTIKAAERLRPMAERFWLLQSQCGEEVNAAVSHGLYFNRRLRESSFRTDDSGNILQESLKSFYSIYEDSLRRAQKSAENASQLLEKYYQLK
jgi:hypothetical protein